MTGPEEFPKIKSKETSIIDMDAFRREIDALVAARKLAPASAPRTELLGINTADLTETDAIMWKKVNNYTKGLITQEQFAEYREDTRKSGKESRTNFMQVVNHLYTPLLMEEHMDDEV